MGGGGAHKLFRRTRSINGLEPLGHPPPIQDPQRIPLSTRQCLLRCRRRAELFVSSHAQLTSMDGFGDLWITQCTGGFPGPRQFAMWTVVNSGQIQPVREDEFGGSRSRSWIHVVVADIKLNISTRLGGSDFRPKRGTGHRDGS